MLGINHMTKIAVAGVQSSIGREILSFLEEQGYKAKDIMALEAGSVLGNMVSYGEEEDLDVLNLNDFDFSQVNIALFATTEAIAKQFIPRAVSKGCKVIDCSQSYVSDSDVPLVITGYNAEQIFNASKGIISVPSAAVAQILLPLQKIQKEYGIKRIIISSYTSTSVYGKEAMDELFTQTRKIYMNDSLVYFMRKGLMIYVTKNDSYIISYLLDKPYRETFYIERNSLNKIISLLNKCHINYFYDDVVTFKDNKYSKYLEYGKLSYRIDKLSTNLKNCLYLDNIEEIITKMEKFYE